MSTLNVGTVKATTLQTAAGVEVYTCRAWVNFNGTGTVAIRASGNVSSITDVNTGQYVVNFTNALVDADYVMAGTAGNMTGTTDTGRDIGRNGEWTTTACQIRNTSATSTAGDDPYVGIAIFR